MSKINKIHTSDNLEQEVADILIKNKIDFMHDSQSHEQRLDFYLPDYDIYIEIKKFHSERISGQLQLQENVIVLQGRKSVDFFCKIFNR